MHWRHASRTAFELHDIPSMVQPLRQPTIVACTHARHAEAIRAIFNDAILTSTAIYDEQPRSAQSMVAWFDAKRAGGFPVLGVEDANGQLLAFGSYGRFRDWPANRFTVEHAVYVHRDHRGLGLGRVVLTALIDAARHGGMHALVGAIDADNAASIALHRRLGFSHVGTLRQVGFKFGRWLDLALYQCVLETPPAAG